MRYFGDLFNVKYIIKGYTQKGSTRSKMLAFGLTPNTIIEVIRKAPLGDPLEVKVRGVSLSIRQAELDILVLEPISPEAFNVHD